MVLFIENYIKNKVFLLLSLHFDRTSGKAFTIFVYVLRNNYFHSLS